VEAASSSTSASVWLDRPEQSHQDRRYTGEWQKWHGRWYQKVSMAELSGKRDKSEAPCNDDRLTFVQSRNSGVYLRLQASYVGKADLNGLALVSGQSCRSGSPDGGVFAPRV